MENLAVATGVKQFTLNGGQIISFNTTDPGFMKKLCGIIPVMDEKQIRYESSGDDVKDVMKFLENIEGLNKEMHAAIDEVFGVHIELENVSLFAYADGLPVWANLIFAVMDKMEIGIAEEQKARDPRLQKIMNKYKRK